MAVQKSRKTRAARGMRRSHDSLSNPTLSHDAETGETHRRHHISPDGFYRGNEIIAQKVKADKEEDSDS